MSTSSSRPHLGHNAVAYSRVSTQGQADNGQGRRLQELQIDNFARESGFVVVRRFSDTWTGTGEDLVGQRPEFKEAVRLAKENNWPIIVASFDRLTRNKEVAAELRSTSCKIISASDGADVPEAVVAGKFARAEEEVRIISEKTKAALARRKAAGVRLGNPTNLREAGQRGSEENRRAAHRRDRSLAEDIEALGLPANATAKQIARALRERGRLTPRGRPWTAENLYRRLRRIRPLSPIAPSAPTPPATEAEPGPSASDLANKNWGIF
jgi:DNA invertase Pin-like site-specific DNA recombinase